MKTENIFTWISNIILIFLSTYFVSCNSASPKTILKTENLDAQFFDIDPSRDTSISTHSGIVLMIEKNSLESENGGRVKFVIREALTIADIVHAGLNTTSDKQLLSSAGMFSFEPAEGNRFKIRKPVQAFVPTETYNPNMKFFTADKDNNGNLNWKNPQPVVKTEIDRKIEQGRTLYNANCTNCHRIEQDYTGPGLGGITERRPIKWLYEFTRNPSAFIRVADSTPVTETQNILYAQCMIYRWKPTIMTAFPDLSDIELENLYAYIKSESDKQPGSWVNKTCCDSCVEKWMMDDSKSLKSKKKVDFFQQTPLFKVGAFSVKGSYYQIPLSTTGWINLDMLLKENYACEEVVLKVEIPADASENLSVALIIPEVKLFIYLPYKFNRTIYAYDGTGLIQLPKGLKAHIIAFAEPENGIISYGEEIFNTQPKNLIHLSMNQSSQKSFESRIKAFEKSVNGSQEPIKNSFKDSLSPGCNCPDFLRY